MTSMRSEPMNWTMKYVRTTTTIECVKETKCARQWNMIFVYAVWPMVPTTTTIKVVIPFHLCDELEFIVLQPICILVLRFNLQYYL